MSDPSSSCFTSLLRRYLFLSLILTAVLAGTAFRPSRSLDVEMLQLREEIIAFAREYVGIRYRYAGTSPETGFDCSGFTSFVLKKFDTQISGASSRQAIEGIRVPLSEVMPGDLLFFGRRGRIQHVAMVVEHTPDGIVCVHSTCTRGVVVENVSTSSYWRSRILYARDVLGRRKAL